MTEIARIYVSLIKMNIKIDYVDVGGGLGIDYDGSLSSNTFSVNYSAQEYANDVVYSLKVVCESENLDCPKIIKDSSLILYICCSSMDFRFVSV